MRKRYKAPVPGSYVPRETPLHTIDARAKIVAFAALIVAVCASSGIPLVLLAALMLLALLLGGTTLASGARLLKLAAFVLVIAVSVSTLVAGVMGGGHGLGWSAAAGGLTVTIRIIAVVGFLLSVLATTTELELVEALTRLLSPLRRLGVPVDGAVRAATLALCMVPLAVGEYDRLLTAWRARGPLVGAGSLGPRLKARAALVGATLAALSRRGTWMELTMYDRCYGLSQPVRQRAQLGLAGWLLVGGSIVLAALSVIV